MGWSFRDVSRELVVGYAEECERMRGVRVLFGGGGTEGGGSKSWVWDVSEGGALAGHLARFRMEELHYRDLGVVGLPVTWMSRT